MDNSLVHIPASAFFNGLCKVLIADSIVFLAKLAWALYYTVLGIQDKIGQNHGTPPDESHPDPLLSFILGSSLCLGVLFRHLSNFLAYQDSSHTHTTGAPSQRNFISTRTCASSRAWVTFAIFNLALSTIAVTVLGQLSLGPGIIFILWELLTLLVVGVLKIFIYRYFLTFNQNLNI